MRGVLPIKLNSITFSGNGVKVLNANVLQGVRNPTLTCTFTNTSIVQLSSGLFRSIGRARNVSVVVKDNKDLQYVQNPSTGASPGLYTKTFLIEFRLVGNKLHCDCDIGYDCFI